MDLRVVLLREGPYWVAQGLEYDVGAQGENLKDVVCRLGVLLTAEASSLAQAPPSPKYFQDLWTFQAGAFQPDAAFMAGFPKSLHLIFALVA